ncbi:MAG: PP2C family protein-serine/threonine phosphatase [Lachnospiraceae bacterium]|nr:PP2C family protein-serine/threonine phosphatase [Lachnospiraceae bacterium]
MIDEAAIVTCYVDAAAILMMVLLLVLAFSKRRMNLSLRFFYGFCLTLTGACVCSFVCHAMLNREASWCHLLAMIGRTLWEWLTFLVILLWAGYVRIKLYGRDRKKLRIWALSFLPFVVFSVLLVVNLFSGIIFTYSAENRFEEGTLYPVFIAVEAVYFLVSLVHVSIYDRTSEKVRFLLVMPLLVPVVLGFAVQYSPFPYQADVLGFAVGAMLVYLSMAEELLYLDPESGMYNSRFLNYLCDLAMIGRFDARSAMVLEVDDSFPVGCGILQNTLNQKGDVIRTTTNRFLVFLETYSRSEVQLLSTQIEEAVEEHNKAHPDELVRIKVTGRMRTGDEELLTFLRRTTEDQDAGDPVRGVVSMLSDLDRLDNELKLAADIQASVIPMSFPAFPDRNEFDLYASMDPAKMVGGDFYDFFLVDDDHLAMVIADVSDKGIPAALFMMVSKTLIKNQLMNGNDPAGALERVNKQLCERNSSMMFVTVWLAVLEISTGKGKSCNAGHENPGLYRAGKGFELLNYKHNILVGLNEEATYMNREFTLQPGDCIFVYTDGVPEASNASREMFGDERLVESLNRHADAAPGELIRQVREDVDQFAGGAPQFDDITMLCMKYYGKN